MILTPRPVVTPSTFQDLSAADQAARADLAQSDRDIARILGPCRGVAFVGSAKLTEAARFQFARYGEASLYIVNPAGGMAGDIPVYKSVLDLPDHVDLVVVRVGPRHAAKVIEDCGRRGIRQALVFTDGYAEVGAEGAALEAELVETIRRAGVRVIGPNTNDNAFERYPRPQNHRGGSIAVITQSGANGRSVVEGVAMGASFYRWVTTGNEADLEVADFIHHFAGLDAVSAIALYVEGFKSPAKLKVALERALTAGKPVIAIKMGSTEKGARAAATHTGHLAGEDAVVNGLFRQYGVTRVDDIDELLETANLFSKLPIEAGSRCAFYTISGGTAALMAEAADACGVQVPLLPQALQDRLHDHIPRNLNVANPIDNGGVFIMGAEPERRREVLDLVAGHDGIDLLVFGLNAAYGPLSDRLGRDALLWAKDGPKPLVAVWTSVITDTDGYRDLVASGAPIFRSFRKCMRAIAARARYLQRRASTAPRSLQARPLSAPARAALAAGGVLSAEHASALLGAFDVPLARERLVKDAASAAAAAADFAGPVVLKLMSAAIPHKTDLGLVKLGLTAPEDVRATAQAFLDKAATLVGAAQVEGLLVQEQLGGGVEMIVGLTVDPSLGPCLTLGLGGIYAEVLKDVATAPLPVNAQDVREMIASLRLAPLLDGVRGQPAADKDALVELALRVAELGLAAGGRVLELDLNPVLVTADRAVALDALVVAADAPAPALAPEPAA
jgi:acyl-CoA synthetase (NDP forming)